VTEYVPAFAGAVAVPAAGTTTGLAGVEDAGVAMSKSDNKI
jgi:hypothetical protein